MHSSIFVFLGLGEIEKSANISFLKTQLEAEFSKSSVHMKWILRGDLLIGTVSKPHFNYYISFISNNQKAFAEWEEFAKNFQLPWNKKQIERSDLSKIIEYLERNGWSEHRTALSLGVTIYEVIERFNKMKIFTIPSM